MNTKIVGAFAALALLAGCANKPPAPPASTGTGAAKAAATDYAAKTKKHARKTAKPKEKMEYMRAAPMK